MLYLVFHSTSAAEAAVDSPRELPAGYSIEIWRPSWRRIVPPTLGPKFALWWALHTGALFTNRDYAVLIIRRNGRAVHRTCLIPKYFRWPFMKDGDLQISSTWTHPDHRCLGLATYALEWAVSGWAEKWTDVVVCDAHRERGIDGRLPKAGIRTEDPGKPNIAFWYSALGRIGPAREVSISGATLRPFGARD